MFGPTIFGDLTQARFESTVTLTPEEEQDRQDLGRAVLIAVDDIRTLRSAIELALNTGFRAPGQGREALRHALQWTQDPDAEKAEV